MIVGIEMFLIGFLTGRIMIHGDKNDIRLAVSLLYFSFGVAAFGALSK